MADPRDIAVRLTDVEKHYGSFQAVRDMTLDIPDGSFVTLLGPSGCGKTTTLRMIAGLESISAGEIAIKGRRVNEVPIHKRNLGVVFQNYALFPHMSIADNVAFGLKYRKLNKTDAREKVRRALQMVRLPHVEDRFPGQLSGGQQQRIALARAIVIEPDVLLLDEPLSALDANLREDMRVELKRIQRELGIATVFVTHDQGEALAMSDKVVVMSDGQMEQIGTPEDVYNRPASRFVASFLGNSNFLAATVEQVADGLVTLAVKPGDSGLQPIRLTVSSGGRFRAGEPVQVVIRAERLSIGRAPDRRDGPLNSFEALVTNVDYQGLNARYFVEAGGQKLQVINPIDQQPAREGDRVTLHLRAEDAVILDDTGHVHH